MCRKIGHATSAMPAVHQPALGKRICEVERLGDRYHLIPQVMRARPSVREPGCMSPDRCIQGFFEPGAREYAPTVVRICKFWIVATIASQLTHQQQRAPCRRKRGLRVGHTEDSWIVMPLGRTQRCAQRMRILLDAERVLETNGSAVSDGSRQDGRSRSCA